MKFNVLTLFPKMISDYAGESILKRGQQAHAIEINTVDIREFSQNKHHTVDDTPYGGGAGMVMQVEPIYHALVSIDAIPFHKANGVSKLKKLVTGKITKKKKTVLMSPRGRQFDQRVAEEWASLDELTIICGRYEGVDYRVTDHLIDEEISIGPVYVLAGGELGALTIIEAVSRLIPGVLGNPDSIVEETHAEGVDAEYPQYTKPADFLGWKVPEILLSGDHKRISEWRKKNSQK